MKRGSFGPSIRGKARRSVLAGVLACAVLVAAFAPALTASAEETTPVPTRPPGVRLGKLFQRERNVLSYEQLRLTLANDAVKAIQDFIAEQKAQGKNTKPLEAGLAAFQTAIASAQSFHDTAKSTLDAKAGFAADGTVTDPAQARETVKTAGKAERDFHRTMRQARLNLHHAFKRYREANKV